MKKPIAFLLLAGFFFTSHAQTGIKDKEVFVRHVFAAVQENDTAAFLKLFPDKDAIKRFLAEGLNGVTDSTEKKDLTEFIMEYDTMSAVTFDREIKANMLRGLSRTWQKARAMKIDLSKAIFTGWTEVNTETDLRDRVKDFGGYIYFTHEEKEYSLIFNAVTWSEADQCYYGMSFGRITEKGREKDASDIIEMEEITVTEEKYEEPPPPPPAKKKVSTKKTPAPPAKKTTIKH